MKKLAAIGLLAIVSITSGCARPWEVGYDPAYSTKERQQQILRAWDYEGKQLVEDIDHALLLRPTGHLTYWNLR